jgi:hypothetical protein
LDTVSGYTTTYNCIEMHYPFQECIRSLLGFCDEVCIADAGSTDGTVEVLQQMARVERRVKIVIAPVNFEHPRWAIHQDGFLKAKARALCTADFCWQTDTDEIVASAYFQAVRSVTPIVRTHPVVMLPMIEFWGSFQRVRADFMSWKPRLSLNDARITHGIPNRSKEFDRAGHPYPRPYESDSCNYIYKESEEDVPIATPLPPGVPALHTLNASQYEQVFNQCITMLPSVLHVSWLDLPRKISHYRQFWKKFHSSMYNLEIADTAANNVMFDKPWSAVTDSDILAKAAELERIGPRNFHHKIKATEIGRTIPFNGEIPDELAAWYARERRQHTHALGGDQPRTAFSQPVA